MKLSFKYEKYHDVRSNLSGYTAIVILVMAICWYFFIIDASHRIIIKELYQKIPANKAVTYSLKGVTVISLCTFIAYLLIEVFKIHDYFYDRYITRWRYNYAIDFIIPVLVSPLSNHLFPRFYLDSVSLTREYQEDIFYHFVGDGNQTFNKHKVVRFYESVTPYWMSIVNELLIITNILAIVMYWAFFELSDEVGVKMFYSVIAFLFLFAVNRVFVARTLKNVREITREEIFEIHNNHLQELESRLRALCQRLNLGWKP